VSDDLLDEVLSRHPRLARRKKHDDILIAVMLSVVGGAFAWTIFSMIVNTPLPNP
jgi:hypothetical protein